MKKLLLTIIGLLTLLGIGCSDSDSSSGKKMNDLYNLAAMMANTGQVSFSYDQNSPDSSHARYSIAGPINAPAASAVIVTIQNADGDMVYNARSIQLISMNGTYITEPIDLVVGQYRLTQFIVVDGSGNSLYATPVEGSHLANFNLVNDPLPINFSVALNQTSTLMPQVLSVADYTPADFGYATFNFDIVDVINFLAGVMVYNQTSGNYELTDATITISTTGTQLYSGSLQAATTELVVKDGYDSYVIRVTKTGYVDFTRTLTGTELKEYATEPLVIQLSPVVQPALQWTWMSGENTYTDIHDGVYGTKGIGDVTNIPGGRQYSTSWIDSSGNFWLFGGNGYVTSGTAYTLGYFNDLWKYEPTTGIWTWMSGDNTINQTGRYGTKGIGDAANKPGARNSAISWIDSSGNLWLFGGYGPSGSGTDYFNDLWKYEPSTGIWTWISGGSPSYGTKGIGNVNNMPGARRDSISWIDSSGNLWLFGGVGITSIGVGCFNDLWKYEPSIGIWTWMSGDNSGNQTGVYGTKGTGNIANKPGSRSGSISWIDSSGNLWLFGGSGYAGAGMGSLNDLWKYEPSIGIWTWMSGANSPDTATGVYGTKGIANVTNVPGGRTNSISWIDSSGNFWLFGGMVPAVIVGYPAYGNMNDLWRYEPSTGLWTWISGDNTVNQYGVYGTKGTGDIANKCGNRSGGVSWIDSSGNFWLFGGMGMPTNYFNDLWKFRP